MTDSASLLLEPRVRADELAAVDMLACLPSAALLELARVGIPRAFRAGEAVVREGEPGASLFIVRRGRFRVVRPLEDPGLVLDELGPGNAFGELAVLNAAPRSATVLAVTDGALVELRRADVERVLDAHPEGARRMLGVVARSLTLAKEDVARQNQRLEAIVRARTADLRDSQAELVRRLSLAAESRDEATGLHVVRMSQLCQRLALASGMNVDDAELLMHAAAMHDVGKIAIPDGILRKRGPLDADEWEIMKRHTTIGAELLAGSRSPVLRLGESIALTHHERWDGSGYPGGLRGERIPLAARITALCDVFDALISERPYKRAWTPAGALQEIRAQRGRHFDPALVDTFVEIFPELIRLICEVEHAMPDVSDSARTDPHALLAELRAA